MTSGLGNLSPKTTYRVAINSSSDPVALIAAVPGNKIRITSMCIEASGAGTIDFESNTTVLGRMTFKTADPAAVLGYNPDGWFETATGEAFNIDNDSTLTLVGFATYVLT